MKVPPTRAVLVRCDEVNGEDLEGDEPRSARAGRSRVCHSAWPARVEGASTTSVTSVGLSTTQSGSCSSAGRGAFGVIKGHTAAPAATTAASPASAPTHSPAMTRAHAVTTRRAARLKAIFRARFTAYKYHPDVTIVEWRDPGSRARRTPGEQRRKIEQPGKW